MTDRELYQEIKRLAAKARSSGRAKSRRSHAAVASMLFLILGATSIGVEDGLLKAMRDAYTKLFNEWNEESVRAILEELE